MKKELSMSDILSQYIKHKNGAIFQILSHTRPELVWLRTKNKYTAYKRRSLRQGIVDGKWFTINEHEWRQWVKKDNEYIDRFVKKLLKRVILAQLLIENDDSLIEDFEDVPQFRKLLERTNKESERIAIKNYDRLYAVDKTVLQNLTNAIDSITKKMADCDIEEFFAIEKVLDNYLNNREEFKDKPITLKEID